MSTSPENYHTHIFHIKSTNSERFTYTIHFNHKKLTRPTITHADKVMAAIADCSKAIKNLGNGNGDEETRQLIQITERAMQSKTSNAKSTPITTGVPASLSVPLYTNNDTRQTRSMTLQSQQIPQLSTPSLPRVDHSTKKNINTEPKIIRLRCTHRHQRTTQDRAHRQPDQQAGQENALNRQK